MLAIGTADSRGVNGSHGTTHDAMQEPKHRREPDYIHVLCQCRSSSRLTSWSVAAASWLICESAPPTFSGD